MNRSNTSQFSQSELDYIVYARQISRDLNYYFSVIVLPIGVVLNLVSFIVFLRKSLNNKTNMGFLCAVLCGFNVVALTSGVIVNGLLYFGIKVEEGSYQACQFFGVWNRWILHLPSFQQVFMSIDIYISVTYPNRFQKFRSKSSYAKLIVAMVVISFIVNILPFFNDFDSIYTTTSDQNNLTNITTNTTTSDSTCSNLESLGLISDIINVLMRDLIPFSIMLVLNILMIKNLFKSKMALKTQRGTFKKEYQFSISVVAMNFVFLVIYTPWSITFLIYQVYRFNPDLTNEYLLELFLLFQTVSNCLAYINNFSVFFINFIFNTLYRVELLLILKIKNPSQISTTGFTTSSS
nr:G protein-coupled receptor [Proales similis]